MKWERKSEAVRLRNGVQQKKLIQQRKHFLFLSPFFFLFFWIVCFAIPSKMQLALAQTFCCLEFAWTTTSGCEVCQKNCYISWPFFIVFLSLKLNLFSMLLLMLQQRHFIFICFTTPTNFFSNKEMKTGENFTASWKCCNAIRDVFYKFQICCMSLL